jgi:hypothetical protein
MEREGTDASAHLTGESDGRTLQHGFRRRDLFLLLLWHPTGPGNESRALICRHAPSPRPAIAGLVSFEAPIAS